MNCPQCHQPNPDSSKFCIHCGEPLSADPAPGAFPNAAPVPIPSEPAPSWQAQPVVQTPPSQQPAQPPSSGHQPAPAQPPVALPYNPNLQRVEIVDINMTFQSMVTFMVKWSLATIPALLILGAIGGLLFLVFGAVLSGCARMVF